MYPQVIIKFLVYMYEYYLVCSRYVISSCNQIVISIHMQVYVSTVSLLTDDELKSQGITTIGDIATIRAACREAIRG